MNRNGSAAVPNFGRGFTMPVAPVLRSWANWYRSACFVNQERSQARASALGSADSVFDFWNNNLILFLKKKRKWKAEQWCESKYKMNIDSFRFGKRSEWSQIWTKCTYSLKRTGVDWQGWWNFDAKKYNNQNKFCCGLQWNPDEWNKVGLTFKFSFWVCIFGFWKFEINLRL